MDINEFKSPADAASKESILASVEKKKIISPAPGMGPSDIKGDTEDPLADARNLNKQVQDVITKVGFEWQDHSNPSNDIARSLLVERYKMWKDHVLNQPGNYKPYKGRKFVTLISYEQDGSSPLAVSTARGNVAVLGFEDKCLAETYFALSGSDEIESGVGTIFLNEMPVYYVKVKQHDAEKIIKNISFQSKLPARLVVMTYDEMESLFTHGDIRKTSPNIG